MNSSEWFQQFMDKDSLVFDIGANIGKYTEIFQPLCKRVIAVEPQRECYQNLIGRFRDASKVVPVHEAMGQRPTIGTIRRISGMTPVSSMSPGWIRRMGQEERFGRGLEWSESEIVIVSTVDYLIWSYGIPEFIKIDVEGSEPEVLRGLSVKVPFLSFEFHPNCLDMAEECVAELKRIGTYTYNYSMEENFEWATQWTSGPVLLQRLSKIKQPPLHYGDVYARCEQ